MAAAGYDLSGSSGAAASLSGATDQGANYNFGTAYGPGGLILTDQRGSVGANAGVTSNLVWILVIVAIAVFAFFLPRRS